MKTMSQPSSSTSPPTPWECIACTYMNDNGHGLACVMCSTERPRKRSEKRRRTTTITPVILSSTVDKSNIGASSSLEVPHELLEAASKRCKTEEPSSTGDNGVTSSVDLSFCNNAAVSMTIPTCTDASVAARVSLDSSVNDDNDHCNQSIDTCLIDGGNAATPSVLENTFHSIKDGNDYNHVMINSELYQERMDESVTNIKKKVDVCYMCGSDLSHFGLKSRVAHVKRCSTKSSNNLFGGGSKRYFTDDTDPKSMHDEFHNMLDQNNNNDDGGSKWHGDDNLRMMSDMIASTDKEEILKVHHRTPTTKQTSLGQFFNAPVRTLTSVLMAGARQVAKRNSIIVSSKQSSIIATTTTTKTTTMKGSKSGWRSNWTNGASSNNNNSTDQRRNGKCPSYKRITGTDFICDGFYYACTELSRNYFLTHFHSDHYGGLSKSWDCGTIYCSLPTANLVNQQLGVDKKYLHPLALNSPTVIASNGRPITVTLLDANHCPGAVMFLFEVGNRRILHVGDFRWNRELMMSMPQLHSFNNSSSRLDELFLDTTYCDAKYTLPTQQDAISAAIEVAQWEMEVSKKDKSMKTLFLFGSYTIGKEKIYMSVAESLKVKVYVDNRRYRILSQIFPMERMQLFTTKKSDTNLWVVPLGSVNFKQMTDYMDDGNKNKGLLTQPYGRVVGFRPTGWTYTAADKKQSKLPCSRPKPGRNLITSKTSGRFSIHGVPYSEHSSFPELVDCIACLKPVKVIPTVSVSKSDDQVKLLLSKQD